ncbi:hypothetical protein DB30_01911 [Enhygromyxa salina]|uniref:Uncharacterized protein n=1 Tax=Enhygromyxa salina TaxID=215803 RepID=A0A0C1ZKI4_9BACT|nr:hypothetical protein DB30_01911 [Enhygromyxa salina]
MSRALTAVRPIRVWSHRALARRVRQTRGLPLTRLHCCSHRSFLAAIGALERVAQTRGRSLAGLRAAWAAPGGSRQAWLAAGGFVERP